MYMDKVIRVMASVDGSHTMYYKHGLDFLSPYLSTLTPKRLHIICQFNFTCFSVELTSHSPRGRQKVSRVQPVTRFIIEKWQWGLWKSTYTSSMTIALLKPNLVYVAICTVLQYHRLIIVHQLFYTPWCPLFFSIVLSM